MKPTNRIRVKEIQGSFDNSFKHLVVQVATALDQASKEIHRSKDGNQCVQYHNAGKDVQVPARIFFKVKDC